MTTPHQKTKIAEIDQNGLIRGGNTPRPIPTAEPEFSQWIEQVAYSIEFLIACKWTKTGRIGSYQLKHIIENWAGTYISNGAVIRASQILGLIITPSGPSWSTNPNAKIGVTRKSVTDQRKSKRQPGPPTIAAGYIPEAILEVSR